MKIEIDTTALGLPAAATAADVVTHFERQRTALLDAQELVKKVTAAGNLPDGIDVQDLSRRIAVGLRRDQALDVALAQAAHDKTKPHDKPSKDANEAANRGLEEAGLTKMTVEELRVEAANRHIDLPDKATKKEILDLIKAGPTQIA